MRSTKCKPICRRRLHATKWLSFLRSKSSFQPSAGLHYCRKAAVFHVGVSRLSLLLSYFMLSFNYIFMGVIFAMWPRWVRALSTIWVAFDSQKRGKVNILWTLVVLFFGPLLIPFYVAIRPAMQNEKIVGNYFWRLLKACENLVLWIIGLASSAVFIENITTPKSNDLAEVKRAEIKAGSICAMIAVIIMIGLDKFGLDFINDYIEKKYFEK